MFIGPHYHFLKFLYWTRRDIYRLLLIAIVPTLGHQWLGFGWLAIPWVPIALVGTAAAFVVGFKNTQTYNRLWEARQIWGGIINASRSFGIQVQSIAHAPQPVQWQLVQQHIAWLTALRYQLRRPQPWENSIKPHNKEFREKQFVVEEWAEDLAQKLSLLLSPENAALILARTNRAAQLLWLQSRTIAQLRYAGLIDSYEQIELERRLADLTDLQGRCERIKNFPYPRQFASISLFFVWLFAGLLPLGMIHEFEKLGPSYVWLAIPFTAVVGWMFTSMDRVGEATENPFEGGANDVPITTISRAIEIDLLEMMGHSPLPKPIEPQHQILL